MLRRLWDEQHPCELGVRGRFRLEVAGQLVSLRLERSVKLDIMVFDAEDDGVEPAGEQLAVQHRLTRAGRADRRQMLPLLPFPAGHELVKALVGRELMPTLGDGRVKLRAFPRSDRRKLDRREPRASRLLGRRGARWPGTP